MKPIQCLFCGQDVTDLYTEAERILPCPRCGAMLAFTTDTSDIRLDLAQAVYNVTIPTPEQEQQVRILVDFNIDQLLNAPDGEIEEIVSLATAWNPDEMLTTEQVAGIMGWTSTEAVRMAAMRNAFPHKTKAGRAWQIPRKDVYARLHPAQ